MLDERPDGSGNGGGANQHVHFAIVDAHAIHRRSHLLEIRDVGADAQSVSAGMFNFQVGEIQFAFAARQQRDAVSGSGESDCQPLSDAPSGSRYEHTGVGQGLQTSGCPSNPS